MSGIGSMLEGFFLFLSALLLLHFLVGLSLLPILGPRIWSSGSLKLRKGFRPNGLRNLFNRLEFWHLL